MVLFREKFGHKIVEKMFGFLVYLVENGSFINDLSLCKRNKSHIFNKWFSKIESVIFSMNRNEVYLHIPMQINTIIYNNNHKIFDIIIIKYLI